MAQEAVEALEPALGKIPQKYVSSVRSLINKLPVERQKKVIDLITRTYDRLAPSMGPGAASKTVQRHHWILQSLQDEFKFLEKYGIDLVSDERNINYIVGHTGGHKDIYRKFVRKEMKILGDELKRLKRVNQEMPKEKVHLEVQEIIGKIKSQVKENSAFLTDKEIFILE